LPREKRCYTAREKIDRKNELVIMGVHPEFENSGFIVSNKF
jgi:hypothetical protein